MNTECFPDTENASPELLLNIFRDVKYDVSLDDDQDVILKIIDESTAQPKIICVSIMPKPKLLHFYAVFSIKDKKRDRLKLINDLNHELVFSRFSIPKKDTLLAEYFLSYKGDVPSKNIIESLDLFKKVTWATVRQFE